MLSAKLNTIMVSILKKRWTRRSLQYIEACKYLDWRVWDHQWGNQQIYKALNSSIPQAIAKLGSTELGAIRSYLRYCHHDDAVERTELYRQVLYTNAGVFPKDYSMLEKYAQLMLEEVLPELTLVVVWFNWGESAIVKKYCRNPIPIRLGSLSAYLWEKPWTRALANRKVLAVHPFVKSIQQQYPKRRQIWSSNPDILPDFDLDTLQVPLSPALVPPKHSNWFETLQVLKDSMAKKDFDIALIGAGAYSAPLAVHAKKLGRVGIHLGGETQFLFGIKGARWDHNTFYNKYYNEYWVRPLPEETPNGKTLIEDGCYW